MSIIKQLLHRLLYKSHVNNTIIGQKQRAYGVDTSRYEPDFNPDNATPGLIDFCITKATEGTSWKDPSFETLYLQSRKLAVNGAYHYLRSGYTGLTQATFFLNTIAGKTFDILAIDFERVGNTVNDAFVRVLYDCMVNVTFAKPECQVILYTNPDLYDTIIYPAAIRLWGRDVFKDWDLWIAQYYYIVNPDGEPYIKNRTDWKIWQISDQGNPAEHGTTSRIDRDVFNGSKEQLLRWVNKLDIVTTPYAGVTQKQGIVNNQNYFLQTINLSGKRAKVRHFDGTLVQVQKAAQTNNAQIVVNGDDYVKGGAYVPTGMSYTDGKIYTPQFEYRYWLNISKSNIVSYGYGKPPADVYNLTSFIRPLVVAGQLHSSLNDTTNIANTEIHARSILGVNAKGELMILICEGFVNPLTGAAYAGVTLPQAAKLMLDNGAVFAGEHGGGGDAGLFSQGKMQNQSSDRDAGLGWRGVVQAIEIFTGATMADYYKIIGNDGGNHTVRDHYSVKGNPIYYPGVGGSRVYITNTIGAESLAAEVYTYPADVPDATMLGGFLARKGDIWRKVYKVGSTAIAGWTAEIHLGVRQGITLTPVTVTPPPPPAVSPVVYTSNDIDLLAKTMTITLKKQDGTSETLSYPIA